MPHKSAGGCHHHHTWSSASMVAPRPHVVDHPVSRTLSVRVHHAFGSRTAAIGPASVLVGGVIAADPDQPVTLTARGPPSRLLWVRRR